MVEIEETRASGQTEIGLRTAIELCCRQARKIVPERNQPGTAGEFAITLVLAQSILLQQYLDGTFPLDPSLLQPRGGKKHNPTQKYPACP